MPAAATKAEKIANATHYDGLGQAALVGFSSHRAPMRGEVLVIGVGTTSAVFNVPDGSIDGQPKWPGRHVLLQAHGGDVALQFSEGTNASVDDAQVSTTSQVEGRTSLAPAGGEAFVVFDKQSLRVPVPAGARTFAVKGSVACKLRTALAET